MNDYAPYEDADDLIASQDRSITRLRAREARLVEALKDAQVAVELLADEVDIECDGLVYDPAFELCGHSICARVGCMKWKVRTIEQALLDEG